MIHLIVHERWFFSYQEIVSVNVSQLRLEFNWLNYKKDKRNQSRLKLTEIDETAENKVFFSIGSEGKTQLVSRKLIRYEEKYLLEIR